MSKKSFKNLLTASVGLMIALTALQCTKFPSESKPGANRGVAPSMTSNLVRAATTCDDGVQNSGALYRICMPELWNGDLVVWAHGYTNPNEPLQIPDDRVDGTPISEIVAELGYAYAATSFSKNGLAVKEGVADLVDLVDIFTGKHGEPDIVYLLGASEGGLITTLAVENNAQVFDGGLPACGPIGDFRKQINYFGDFRVVFDYFFPGVIPGSAVNIPQQVMDNWDAVYAPRIKEAIAADPDATRQLLNVTGAATDADDPSSIEETVTGVLWYNVFATNDANEELGGQAFDNMNRLYVGSDDDMALNSGVQRFRADAAAIHEIEATYQTSGNLSSPVVTLHTTADPIVPYWHEPLYFAKVLASGSFSYLTPIPIERYGHCEFTMEEVLAAFAILVFRVSRENLFVVEDMFPNAAFRAKFVELAGRHGATPEVTTRQNIRARLSAPIAVK